MMKKVTKAVIPAAGLGTRVLPATKAMPKGMLPIVDKPAIQYLVEEAVRSGITDILIILSRNQSIIEDHFDRSPELEAKLAQLKGRNIVHRRITGAYPQLLEGKNNGANFRKLKESWERRRNGEDQ